MQSRRSAGLRWKDSHRLAPGLKYPAGSIANSLSQRGREVASVVLIDPSFRALSARTPMPDQKN